MQTVLVLVKHGGLALPLHLRVVREEALGLRLMICNWFLRI